MSGKRRLGVVLCVMLICMFGVSSVGSSGYLDPSFGDFGVVLTSTGEDDVYPWDGDLNANGKIVVAGDLGSYSSMEMFVAQYHSNGVLDTSFGGGLISLGLSGSSRRLTSVAYQSDGKPVVAGHLNEQLLLMRLNTDGTLDTTFGNAGIVHNPIDYPISWANDVVIQDDGKIIVAGFVNVEGVWPGYEPIWVDALIARFNPNGTLDTSFSGDGYDVLDLGGCDRMSVVAVQADGKILSFGRYTDLATNPWYMIATRYTTQGNLDTTFGANGTVYADVGYFNLGSRLTNAVIQDDGKAVVQMARERDYLLRNQLLVRLTTTGALDNSFGTGGVVRSEDGVSELAIGLTLQPDGKLLTSLSTETTGLRDTLIVRRRNSDGSVDTTFGVNGVLTGTNTTSGDNVAGLLLQPDSKPVVFGRTYDNAVVLMRFTENEVWDVNHRLYIPSVVR